MTNIAFRISLPFIDVKLDELYALCDRVAIYEHPADATVERTHIHGLLLGCKRKEDTIRNNFFKDKYEYSMKTKYKNRAGRAVPVDINFMAYMAKGIYDPSFLKGITMVEADYYKSLWAKREPANVVCFEGKLTTEQIEKAWKVKRLTKRQLIDTMMISYHHNMETEEVLLLIREVLMANNEVLGRWKCMDFYDALLMYADADRWMDGIVYQINKRDRKT